MKRITISLDDKSFEFVEQLCDKYEIMKKDYLQMVVLATIKRSISTPVGSEAFMGIMMDELKELPSHYKYYPFSISGEVDNYCHSLFKLIIKNRDLNINAFLTVYTYKLQSMMYNQPKKYLDTIETMVKDLCSWKKDNTRCD